jgi:hypothetical protein
MGERRGRLMSVQSVAFSLEFRGYSTALSPGVVTARATAPGGELAQNGAEALLERRLTFLSETSFEEAGTISFGSGDALRFRSVGLGSIGPSPRPGLRQGTAAWVVDGGSGAFAGACGRIVSNFLVSDAGELTDHQLGVVFLADPTERAETA